jgi:hypothetical protein
MPLAVNASIASLTAFATEPAVVSSALRVPILPSNSLIAATSVVFAVVVKEFKFPIRA